MARRTDAEKYDKNKLDLFKNRLMYLMVNSPYNSANKLAVALLEHKLVRVKHRDETKPINKPSSAVASVENKILRHLEQDNAERVQGEYIKAYSRLFNVSTEYMLCLTDTKSPDMDVRGICEWTGLSEELITVLKKKSPLFPYGKWINRMFETGDVFFNFIDSLEEFSRTDFDKPVPNPHDDDLRKRFDEETINKAYDIVTGPFDYEHEDLGLSEKEKKAVKLAHMAIDFAADAQADKDLLQKVLRYELDTSARDLLRALFPEERL